MTATISFRAKVESLRHVDGSPSHQRVKVPKLSRSHCDMNAFRSHPRFGGLANSDLFPNALARIARDVAPTGYLRLDALPTSVSVDLTGFLAAVTITVA